MIKPSGGGGDKQIDSKNIKKRRVVFMTILVSVLAVLILVLYTS